MLRNWQRSQNPGETIQTLNDNEQVLNIESPTTHQRDLIQQVDRRLQEGGLNDLMQTAPIETNSDSGGLNGPLQQRKQNNLIQPEENKFSFLKLKSLVQEVKQTSTNFSFDINQIQIVQQEDFKAYDRKRAHNSDDEMQSDDTPKSVRNIWGPSIEIEMQDMNEAQIQQENEKHFMEDVLSKHPDFHFLKKHMLTRGQSSKSKFAFVVSTITVIIHVYNFFTCWFFMGIEGFPTGLWFALEIFSELFLVMELIMQILLRTKLQTLWVDMYLMRDLDQRELLTWSQLARFTLVAFPRASIFSIVIGANDEFRQSFWYAAIRILKLLRQNEIARYFNQFDMLQRKKKSSSMSRLLFNVYFCFAFLHLWSCVWLITGRLDWTRDTAGWYRMAKFDMLGATWYERYMESVFFTCSTFAGQGFGNIIPTTNFEWFVDTIINLLGKSAFGMIFVDFVMEFLMRDLKQYKNNQQLQSLLQFAEQMNLPDNLVFKICYFQKNLSLNFQDFLLKKEIVNEMPQQIKGKVSVMLNREIVERVKFFQMSDPEFIYQVSCLLTPEIFMDGDFVVKKDDVADRMYFIHSGYLEVLCTNNKSTLVYLGKGQYFGEIGVLLTGTRSVSVRSKSNTVVYYIEKENLLQLLQKFPKESQFLRQVAEQRLETTPFDNEDADDGSSTQLQSSVNQDYKTFRYSAINQIFQQTQEQIIQKKPLFRQKYGALQSALIQALSPMWWCWNLILSCAIFANCVIIPYGIGFEQIFWNHPAIIISWIIYAFDIPIRARTAIVNGELTTDSQAIFRFYINKWLIIDVISMFPFEYFLVATRNKELVPYVLLLRILKLGRLVEISEIIRNNTRFSYQVFTQFAQFFVLWGLATHFYGCFLGWLGRIEQARNPKYDGNYYFKDFASRPYVTFGKFEDMPFIDQYYYALYTAAQVFEVVIGDIVPQSNREQTSVCFGFILVMTLRAFLIVNFAKYLELLHEQQIIKINKSSEILQFMKSNSLSKGFIVKINAYAHKIRHEKSVWEGIECINNLPSNLQKKVKKYLSISQTTGNKVNVQDNESGHDTEMTEKEEMNLNNQYKRFLKIKYFVDIVILVVIIWNLIFIPLQFAFRLPITGKFLVFELITIIAYLFDVFFDFYKINWVKQLNCVESKFLRRKDKIIKSSLQMQNNEISKLRWRVTLTIIAVFPFSLFMEIFDQSQKINIFVKCGICCIRLLKYQPISKFFMQKQKDELVIWRIISTIQSYYLYAHICSCIWVLMAYWDDDWTQNWLRRCPVPQITLGTRIDPLKRDDLSPLSVYIHALYYIVSAVSIVGVGDISAVRPIEWFANFFFFWVSFFVYCFLFADNTLLVSKLRSQNYKEYLTRRNNVIQQLNNPQIPKYIKDEAVLYLDVAYQNFDCLNQDDVLKKLPDDLKLDFILEKYKIVVEQFLPFRNLTTGNINYDLAQDILKALSTQIFLNETFILKVGEIFTDAIIVLQGCVNVSTVQPGDILGALKPGDYFALDLDQTINKQFDAQYYKKSMKEPYSKLELSPTDNLDNRSLVHLIAIKSVTVGYLSQDQLQQIYQKYPSVKSIMQRMNRYLFDIGKKAIENALLGKKEKTREQIVDYIESQYEKSSNEDYKNIVKRQRPVLKFNRKDEYIVDISKQKKLYMILSLEKESRTKLKTIFFPKIKQRTKKNNFIVCCEELLIHEDSTVRSIIDIVQFFNKIYIALLLPFIVGFNIPMDSLNSYYIAELVSHLIAFMYFMLQFRTLVILDNGEQSIDHNVILKFYKKHGYYQDILSFIPFNLIIPIWINTNIDDSYQMLAIVIGLTPFRILRLLSLSTALTLFDKIKINFQSTRSILTIIGNIFFCFLLGHWCVCSWSYLCFVIERKYALNFFQFYTQSPDPNGFLTPPFQQGSRGTTTWEYYLRAWYSVANIITTTGSGDIIGVTDLERVFITVLISLADVCFALAFGLLAELTSSQKQNNSQTNFVDYLESLDSVMQKEKFNQNWKNRVQEYMTYKFQLKTSPKNINAEMLKEILPDCLIKEITYYSNKAFIEKLFYGIESENLVRDLAFFTNSKIYMPDDVIMMRKAILEEIQFIVEGNASKMNKKNKPIENLYAGDICGNYSLSKNNTAKYTVRANTYMLVKTLQSSDIESILKQYPMFLKDLLRQSQIR